MQQSSTPTKTTSNTEWTLNSYNSEQESIGVISEDFSVVRSDPAFSDRDTEWPDSLLYQSRVPSQTPISGDYTQSSETILSSHFALSTAYEKLKRKLAESEKENQLLRKQQILDRGQMASSMNHNTTQSLRQTTSHSLNDSEINRAWEAYREKCHECEQMRDELKAAQQQIQNSQQASRIQNLHEEVHREKARYSDLQQELTSCRGSMEHIGKKELLAREELLKEQEYQQSLIAETEKKHNEMQSQISGLEQQLVKEQESKNEILRGHKEDLSRQNDAFIHREDQYKAKIRGLEEKVIELQERLTTSYQQINQRSMQHSTKKQSDFNSYNSSEGSTSEADMIAIVNEIKSLTTELNAVKNVSRRQHQILQAIIDTPGIENLLKELQLNGSKQSTTPAATNSIAQFPEADMSNSYPSSSTPFSTAPSSLVKSQNFSSEIKIKRTDDFIRDLNRGKQKQPNYMRPSTVAYPPSVIGVQRTIHTPAHSGSYSSSHGPNFSNNIPSSFQNNQNFGMDNNDALQAASLSSDDGEDSSMLTLQAEDKTPDMEMSSDEDSAIYVPAMSTAGASQVNQPPTIRPDIRAKYNAPEPTIVPMQLPLHPYPDTSGGLPTCPVCNYKFMTGSTEVIKNRHINSHFSDDDEAEGEFLEMP